MKPFQIIIFIFIFFSFLSGIRPALSATELESRYATILYTDTDHLRQLNNDLTISFYTPYAFGGESIQTDIMAKIDAITEKVMSTLDMYPTTLQFSIHLLQNTDKVKEKFLNLYGFRATHIAFYSSTENRIYLSVGAINLGIVAHEIGHAVVENYYDISPSRRVHEVMAQYAETHITR